MTGKRQVFNKMMLACVIIGIGLIAAGYSMGGATSFYMNMDGFHAIRGTAGANTSKIQENLTAFDTVRVDMTNTKITIVSGDTYSIDLRYDSNRDFSWDLSEGVLTVREKTSITFFNFDLSWLTGVRSDNRLVITCPEPLRELTVETVSGKIICEALEAEMVALSSVSGAIDATDLNTDSLSAESVSGAIDAKGLVTKSLTLETVSGAIKAEGAINGRVRLASVSGAIRFNTTYPRADFSIGYDLVSGSLHVNGTRVKNGASLLNTSAPYTVTISEVSGSARLTFAD